MFVNRVGVGVVVVVQLVTTTAAPITTVVTISVHLTLQLSGIQLMMQPPTWFCRFVLAVYITCVEY